MSAVTVAKTPPFQRELHGGRNAKGDELLDAAEIDVHRSF
jgi:hypothetical protein